MKEGLLITSPVSDYKNIGDYIQSLAAKQFIDNVDCFIEKESIDEKPICQDNEIRTILNAWFMWNPENWPPHENIKPLVISMHLSPLTREKMLTNEGINFFRKNEPIGCRDIQTHKFLTEKGINSYFSGCLTLTLGLKYKIKPNEVRKGLIFVDPYISPLRDKLGDKYVYYHKNVFLGLWYFIKSFRKVYKLSKNPFFHGRVYPHRFYNAAMFYNAYKNRFSDKELFEAKYITHMVPVDSNVSHENLLNESINLIKQYSQAELVITSRIHCALPCLGLETPILFILHEKMNSKENLFNAPGRFEGITNLFNTLGYTKNKLHDINVHYINSKGKSLVGNIKNPDNFIEYRDKLISTVKSFYR